MPMTPSLLVCLSLLLFFSLGRFLRLLGSLIFFALLEAVLEVSSGGVAFYFWTEAGIWLCHPDQQ